MMQYVKIQRHELPLLVDEEEEELGYVRLRAKKEADVSLAPSPDHIIPSAPT